MSKKCAFIGRWCYSMPDAEPNDEGRIVLIRQASFGPLEVYDWGIDEEGIPYEEYEWCENDWFKDDNYFRHISKEELEEQIEKLIGTFTEHGLSEMADAYKNVLNWLNTNG